MSDDTTHSRLDTVTPPYFGRPDAEMDSIGWGIFLTLLVVLFPLLPFLLIVLLVSKTLEFLRRQTI